MCVKSHLTSGASICPENPVAYSAERRLKNCGVFSETARLQRSSTPPLKAVRTVGHFPVESAHAYLPMRRSVHNGINSWRKLMARRVLHLSAFISNVFQHTIDRKTDLLLKLTAAFCTPTTEEDHTRWL